MAIAQLIIDRATLIPGATFNLTWVVCPTGQETVAPQTPTIAIGPHVLFPHAELGDSAAPATSGHFRVDTARLRAAGLDERAFYRTGSTGLITLTVEPPVPPANARYTIGTTPAPRLHFTGPDLSVTGVGQALWKQPYSCAVEAENTAPADVRITLALQELGATPTTIGSDAVTLVSRERQTITFPPITKDWMWLLDGFIVNTGPFSQTYGYSLTCTGTDAYGNTIAPIASPHLDVIVSVAPEKTGWGAAAESAFTVAIGLDISAAAAFECPCAAAGLALAAVAAHVTAETLAAAAHDPPTPDPAFATPVATKLPDPKAFDGLAGKAMIAWLRAASELAARRMRLYAIEAKVLGAHQAQDAAAEAARVADYTAELRAMSQLYVVMATNASAAAKETQDAGATPQGFATRFKHLRTEAASGHWSADTLKAKHAGVDLDRLAHALERLKPEQMDVREMFHEVTLAAGKAVKLATEDAVRRYAGMRPAHFTTKP